MSRSSSADIESLTDIPIAEKTLLAQVRERLLALSDQVAPHPISRRGWILVGALALLILLPTLFFPLSHDQAMYYLSGRMILDGAIHYRDIVDIKPPLIYHLYAFAILLFGEHVASIRILDLVLQLATCALVCLTIRRASGSDLWGAMAVLIYPLSYVGLSFGSIAQTECYTGLLGFGALYQILFRRNTAGFMTAGALVGLLFLLKLTLGIVLAVAFLGELLVFDDGLRRAIWNMIRVTAGFLIPVGAALLYLVAFDALDDFGRMNDFIAGYSGQQLHSGLATIQTAITMVPQYLVNQYSLLMLVLTIVGAAASVPPASKRRSVATVRLLRLSTIAFVLLLLSLVVEGKYNPAHYARVYAVGIVLGTFALLLIVRQLSLLRFDGNYRWFVLPSVAILLVFFSPLVRYLYHAGVAAAYVRGGDRAIDSYYDTKASYTRGEILDIRDFYDRERSPQDRIYVMSANAGMVYQLLDMLPPHKVFHMAFVVAPFAPEEWRQSTARHILETRPAFIAVQTNDSIPDLIGVGTTSDKGLLELPGVGPVIESEYVEAMHTDHFVLLRRMKK